MTAGTRSDSQAAAIERDLEDTRQRIDVTLAELIDRLSPGELLDQALHYLRRGTAGPGRFASNLGHAIQEHPLPVALIGLGIGWLAIGERMPVRRAHALPEDVQESEAAGLRHKVEGVVESAQHRVSAVGERIRSVGERAQEATHRIGERAAAARGQGMRMLEEQPLLIALAGLAIGAALGGSLPSTESEDELLGRRRDQLIQRGAEAASQGAEAARSRIEHGARDDAPGADPERPRRGDGHDEARL